jgi:hypothetical protein
MDAEYWLAFSSGFIVECRGKPWKVRMHRAVVNNMASKSVWTDYVSARHVSTEENGYLSIWS